MVSPIQIPLLSEYSSTHLKNGFEALPALFRVLTKSLHADFLDLILDFLPPTADSGYLSILPKVRLSFWHRLGRLIDDRFSDVQHIRPCQIGGAHCHLLRDRVDVGDFIDMRGGTATEERQDPLRR